MVPIIAPPRDVMTSLLSVNRIYIAYWIFEQDLVREDVIKRHFLAKDGRF